MPAHRQWTIGLVLSVTRTKALASTCTQGQVRNRTVRRENSARTLARLKARESGRASARRDVQIKLLIRKWSGRKDLNLRPPGPEPGALARLRYAPNDPRQTVLVRAGVTA